MSENVLVTHVIITNRDHSSCEYFRGPIYIFVIYAQFVQKNEKVHLADSKITLNKVISRNQ